MPPKRQKSTANSEIDTNLDAASESDIGMLPKKRSRGRPPGSLNKVKSNDTSKDDRTKSDAASSNSVNLRKNPDRLLKGKGGEVERKQQISKAIDPTELKAQAEVTSAAKSPISPSAPLNPYAPASLKPVKKKKSTKSTGKLATRADIRILPAPVPNTANEVPNLPATFQSASGALPTTLVNHAYRYPSYSLTLPAPDANMIASSTGAATMGGPTTTSENARLSGYPAEAGAPAMAAFAMGAEASMITGYQAASGFPTVTGAPFHRQLHPSVALPSTASRYGFQQPSSEATASETVGMSTEMMTDAHMGLQPNDDPLDFGFQVDLDLNMDIDSGISFLDKSSGSSNVGHSTNITDNNNDSYSSDVNQGWSQDPLDLVYVAPNCSSSGSSNDYIYSQPTEQPDQAHAGSVSLKEPNARLSSRLQDVYVAPTNGSLDGSSNDYIYSQPTEQPDQAHAETVSPKEPNAQLSSRLQDELFDIEDEDQEEKTNDEDDSDSDSDSNSGTGSESDNSETDDDDDELTKGLRSSGKKHTSEYVAPAKPRLSSPYAGAVFSLPATAVSSAIEHKQGVPNMKARSVSQASFIGNVPVLSQSLDSFNVGGSLRKRKPRSDVTVALLRYGSTVLQSHSPSPAPSSISTFSHSATPSMPGLTPAPSLVSEQNLPAPGPVITHEDRAYYAEEYQEVYDYARDLCRLSYAIENAFPECPKLFKEAPEVKLQDILVNCVDKAIAAFELQGDPFLQKHKFGIALGISKDRSTFRGDVKTYARKAVASLLSIRKELQKKKKKKKKKKGKGKGKCCEEDDDDDEPISPIIQKHRTEVIAKVKDLFKDDKYLLGGTDLYGNYVNYGSTVIQKVINDVFYSHDQKLGFLFEKEFRKEVPKRVVALVASAVQCALMEYEKHGYLRTLRFDPKDFAKRYRRHVRGIERLEKVSYHRKLFHTERKKWASANWSYKDTVDGTIVDNESEEPPVHLRLEFYLPPGVELSDDSEEE